MTVFSNLPKCNSYKITTLTLTECFWPEPFLGALKDVVFQPPISLPHYCDVTCRPEGGRNWGVVDFWKYAIQWKFTDLEFLKHHYYKFIKVFQVVQKKFLQATWNFFYCLEKLRNCCSLCTSFSYFFSLSCIVRQCYAVYKSMFLFYSTRTSH